MGEFVRLEVDEASRVGTIRLDRPPVNALNAQIQAELQEVAAEAGVPVGTMRSCLYHGLRALRMVLEERGWSG